MTIPQDYTLNCNYCCEEIYYEDANWKVDFYRTHLGERAELYFPFKIVGKDEEQGFTVEYLAEIIKRYLRTYGGTQPHDVMVAADEPHMDKAEAVVKLMQEQGKDFELVIEE